MGHSSLLWNTARLQKKDSGGNTGTSGSQEAAVNNKGNTKEAPQGR